MVVQADGRSVFCLEARAGKALGSTGILWMQPTGDGNQGWGPGKPQAKQKEFLCSDVIKGIGLTAETLWSRNLFEVLTPLLC